MIREQWQAAWKLYQSLSDASPTARIALLESSDADSEVKAAVRQMLLGDKEGFARELDRIGQKVGRYLLTSRLGTGGMGEVYAARDLELGRPVALKLLHAGAARLLSAEQFVREAKAASSLNHPNIITIYEVIHSPSSLAIVMELVDGVALRQLCGSVNPVDTVLHVGEQVARALAAAHAMGIVHCDIKPENLMLRPDGVAKVMDFGLARDIALTNSTVSPAAGTLRYMSPEQSQGHLPTCASDIFSLGIVLYELSTGTHPFERGSIFETLKALNQESPDAASTRNPRLPPSLDALFMAMLAKNPEDRPTATAVANTLRTPSAVGVVSLETRQQKGKSSRYNVIPRKFQRVVVGTLLASAALLAGAYWLTREESKHSQHLTRLTIDLGADAIEGRNLTVAVSPDGTRLAYMVRTGTHEQQIATRLLAATMPTVLEGTNGAEDLFFSPDGKWIGFFADRHLKKIAVAGGAAITLCASTASSRGAAWSPEGYIIANLDNSRLMRVPESGGDPQPLASQPEDYGEQTWRWPQILPDRRVLFTGSRGSGFDSGFDDATIRVLSLDTGKVTLLHRGGYFGRYLPSGHLSFVHKGTLFAAPLDLKQLVLNGPAAPVLDDVAATVWRGSGQLDFSTTAGASDLFVYRSGKLTEEPPRMLWIDAAANQTPVMPAVVSPLTPRLSPDSRFLAFSSSGDIYVSDLTRNVTTPLTNNALGNLAPVWTPDAKHIVYSQREGGEGVIWWRRADGSGKAHKLYAASQALRVRSISPDGKQIAFSKQNGTTGWDLWTLSLDTSDADHPKAEEPRVFLQEPNDQAYPSFSPDGKWIAYSASGSDEMTEAYARPFPADPNGQTVQISTGGGLYPLWTGDGKEILFLNRSNKVMRVRWDARGSQVLLGKPEEWSAATLSVTRSEWNFDIAADGKRMIALHRDSASMGRKPLTQVTVLLNFFQDLKRRLP